MESLLQNQNLKRAVIAVLVLLSFFLLAKSINEFKLSSSAGDNFAGSTIVVSGKGEVSVVPDIATFSFTVTQEEKTVKEAQEIVSKKISNILASLNKLNIDKKDINTQSYNVYPRYEYFMKQQLCPEGYSCPPPLNERTLTGYEVSQTISVKLRDIDKAGEVLDTLGNLEISNLNGPNFDMEKREELVRKARKMAIDDAKKKAKELAKDLDVRLGKVVNFSEGGRDYYAKNSSVVAEDSFGTGGGFSPEIPVGESEISSNVEIVYEIK